MRSEVASGQRCGVAGTGSVCFAKRVDGDGKHHRIPHGLDKPHWKLDQAAVEHAPGGSDAVRNVFAKLDADRLDPPLGGVKKDRPDRADGLPVRRDHGPSAQVFG